MLLLAVFASLLMARDIEDDAISHVDAPMTQVRNGPIDLASPVSDRLSIRPSLSTIPEQIAGDPSALVLPTTIVTSTVEPAIPTSISTPVVEKITSTRETVADVTATSQTVIEMTETSRPIYATRNVSITINGLPLETFVVLPRDVVQHAGQIFRQGQALGRQESSFSVVGDSIADPSAFLTGFDEGQYGLGDYAHLQPTIEYYSGSFGRQGLAVRPGLNLTAVFDPLWADKEQCEPNETILDCEIRLHNPSVLLILVGTNDAAVTFEERMGPVLQYTLDKGVIPVLVSKALPVGGADNPRNEIIRQLAAEYKIPLLDYGLVADTLPNKGLDADGVHMTLFPEHDYALFRALESGYGALNLTTLMVLDAIWQDVILTAD